MATNAQSIQFLLSQVRRAAGSLDDGTVTAYAAGTTNPKTIWLDRGKQTEAANPYTLDANGTAQLFGDGLYRFVVKDSLGITVYDRDYISIKDATGLASDVADYASLAAAVAAIGSSKTTLQYGTNQTVTANLTVPSTLELVPMNGAVITVNSGVTLTINGPFNASRFTSFAGPGTVVFGAGALHNNLSGSESTVKDYKFLSGVIRNVAGTWDFIDDTGHAPTNLSSLTEPDVYTLRLNYGATYGHISTFILNVDDALAPYGVVMGSDVGTAYANLSFHAPFECVVNGDATFATISGLWSDYATATANSRGLTIGHPQAQGGSNKDSIALQIEAVADGATTIPSFLGVANVTATSFDIVARDNLNGFIAYSGSAWSQTLSTNIDAPTLTWTASNTLAVAHDSVGKNVIPQLTGFGGVYIPQIVNIGDASFEVAFYDYAGTKITTPNANMKFAYSRAGSVASQMPAGLKIHAKRGYCQIPPDGIKNIGGNNFWVFAVMEK